MNGRAFVRARALFGDGSGGGANPVIEPLEITENGTYTAPSGVDGYSPITVEVASSGTDERFKQLVEGTLTEINDSEITTIKSYTFYARKSLTNVNLPRVTTIGDNAFQSCDAISSFSALNVTALNAYAFNRCKGLTEIKFPKLESINSYVFMACNNLQKADLGIANSLSYSVLSECFSLKSVILRKTKNIVSLETTNAFYNCYHFLGTVNATYNPEGKKDGYIYVPSALIEQYKVATNWTTFATQFRALEDYTVDGTTTGELDWEKVNAS